MKAAVLHAIGQPLAIQDVPTPEPGPGEVLVKVDACGVCHSDLHLAEGDWELLKPITKIPLILGHEVVGTVAALGAGASGVRVGQRVGVPWIHWTCGACDYCRAGRETLCIDQKITGCTVDGGYAEYITAPATHAARIPPVLADAEAAPFLCAGVTVYKAIKSSGIGAGERLAVFGVGGLGHLAVQMAIAQGIQVIAVDIAAGKLDLARSLGADATVNAATEVVHRQIRSLGGAHVAMVTSASRAAYESALRSLRRGGTLLVVGMAAEPFPVSAVSLVSAETRIVASAVGTRADLAEMFDLATRFPIRCRHETRPLEAVGQVFEELKRGEILGRVVLTP